MSYDEAIESMFSRAQVVRELQRHGLEGEELDLFFQECGNHAEYSGEIVLDWLGY